ncbi:Polysaccharide deacetylase [Halogranum amylolyticum]|uniref:Polysaccharide deacetylase n=1 Tax=Halogranum amylolyticum TaxID=660520 RepID=A0A1H8MUY9_9EURY|nr:polysaccharide deacetylase family protein [Halogranum amylolyticum]SEO21167.1 Polysaccharide deacetylase [Halogranum amylolyticum]
MNSVTPTRRQYVQAAAAGIGLSAIPVASAQESNGQLVFVYDDSPASDYSKAFPVHREEDAPACVGAIASVVEADDEGLSRDQLLEMQDAGWEVMSHTLEHRAVGPITITEDVESGDERVYVERSLHGGFPGDTVLITDDDDEEVATVVGGESDERGDYLLLEEPVEGSYAVDDGAYERLTDDVLERATKESKERLESMGFDVDSFVFPYGRRGPAVMEFVEEHYAGVANYDYDGLNPGEDADPYRIGREYFREERMSETEITDFLDTVQRDGMLGMFAGHNYADDLTQERIRFAIRQAKQRGIEIVTLREAFAGQGLLDESDTAEGETTQTPTATPTQSPTPTRSSTATQSPTSQTSQTTSSEPTTSPSSGSTATPGTLSSKPTPADRSNSSFLDGVLQWLSGLF